MKTFETHESSVRSYIRSFPTVFTTAFGHDMVDEDGKTYLDFFAGAGALNYGHNCPRLKRRLLAYLEEDGIVHSLDMATTAKRGFIERFHRVILEPRNLDYKFLFPGPTGTNAVEAALKLARKATARQEVYGFRKGFHGMTLGSLAITANPMKRRGAGLPLRDTSLLPFEGDEVDGMDSLTFLRERLKNAALAETLPAAIVLETVQCEGGVNVASSSWLREVSRLAAAHGVLLVVDDIQAGCGRTGRFFSFEEAGITPDIVCLSKSLSGLGLPLALVLLRPELDVFQPGEHNGTFRGHNPAFVTATEALSFWEDDAFAQGVRRKAVLVRERLEQLAERFPEATATVRGRGLVQGLAMNVRGLPSRVAKLCFGRGLIIETAGHDDEVLKVLPPLTISLEALERGLDIIEDALRAALAHSPKTAASMA